MFRIIFLSFLSILICTQTWAFFPNQNIIHKKDQPSEFQPLVRVPETTGDTVTDPFEIFDIPFQTQGTTLGFNNDYDSTCPYPDSVAPDVVYHFVLQTDAYLDIDLCGSSYDTKVYVMDSAGSVLACNDDAYSGSECGNYVSRLQTGLLDSSEDLYIVIDGYGDSAGQYMLDVSRVIFDETDCSLDNYWWAQRENEPPLKPGYVDNFNGGCNAENENFTNLVYSQLRSGNFIGKTGYFSPTSRDSDWFHISSEYDSHLEITITSSGPVTLYWVEFMDCNDVNILEFCHSTLCQPSTIEIFEPTSFSGWFVVVPTNYESHPTGLEEYEYLLEFGSGGAAAGTLPPTADTGLDCPRVPEKSLILSGKINDFENDYNIGLLDCLPNSTNEGDAVLEIYLAEGENLQGTIQPTTIDQPTNPGNRTLASYSIVDDLRMQPGSCLFGSYGEFNHHFSVTAPTSGFYYLVADNNDGFDNILYGMSVRGSSEIPEPPANNTCEGADTIPLGAIALQGDLTNAWNSYDAAYRCSNTSPEKVGIGDTGRDIVYRIDFVAGQELDLHMEGLGDWDEALYLVSDCDNSISTCLASSWNQGTGVQLQYTADQAHTAWLICDSWGVGDRLFTLSGTNGFPALNITKEYSPSNPSGLRSHPNPFNPRTTISFDLPQDAVVQVEIFGLDGRRVKTLIHESLTAGHHNFEWNGNDDYGRIVAAGTYFCRLSSPSESSQIRMVLLK